MTAESFFKGLQSIIESHPKIPSLNFNSVNCDYGNGLNYCKNLYHAFDNGSCSDSCYLSDSYLCANCLDCDYAVESELCYESVDPFKCFNCDYIEYCGKVRDSSFCYDCTGCHDVFGCVRLENKSFCIFNRQLTEAEYREKVKELRKLPAEKILAVVEDLKARYPLTQTIGGHNENTTYGNYIHYNKNCYMCFDAAQDENCAYLYDSFYCSNSLDLTYCAHDVDLAYQGIDSSNIFNCGYTFWSSSCRDSTYLFGCTDVKDSLGCVDLYHKEYCILNRQFTKEEYEKISSQILEDIAAKNLGWSDLLY